MLEILTLGHLAMACCMISILSCAEIPWLDMDLRTFYIKSVTFGPLLVPPLTWSLDKGVSSFSLCYYFEQPFAHWPTNG